MPEISHGSDRRDDYAHLFKSLFSAAFTSKGFDALCTVLRVGGMEDANWDPLEESRAAFDDYNWMLETAAAQRSDVAARRISLLMYCQAVEMTAPYEILANLLRIIGGQHYTLLPFEGLGRAAKKGDPLSRVPPSAKQKVRRIKELATAAGRADVSDALDKFFDERVRNAFSHSDYILTDKYFRFTEGGLPQQLDLGIVHVLITECFAFYGAFLGLHRRWLQELGRGKRFHKWPSYEVLELLSSEEEGVFGFHVHFSNGSRATYTRRRSGIEAINLVFEPDGNINFMVGNLDELEPIWKVNGKPVEDWNALP